MSSRRTTLGVLCWIQQQIQKAWLRSGQGESSRIPGCCGESVGYRRRKHWPSLGPSQSSLDWRWSWSVQEHRAHFVPPFNLPGLLYPIGPIIGVTLRELYCPHCEHYHHRDVMAAENISRIVRGHLEKQERPLYLQPRTADGRYPWQEDPNMNSSTVGTSNTNSSAPMTSASTSTGALPRGRKRTPSVSNKPRKPGKKAKEAKVSHLFHFDDLVYA
ncbi:hypothetical protein BC939DRAFT_9100 [Gamsiella multidivaricata]|uniref:uncharacterized protein n=1 Tax=Gamsiella multidivaricata TaxID=101098 RepID=UPI0022210A9D|nr:uncharacterized protein BC939DRAFT_9100 [Gamsiella multidivaricata]KAI7832855.1 hypothetical protein BC939DRAFT_9100 [Gamsiella multidivaricata]